MGCGASTPAPASDAAPVQAGGVATLDPKAGEAKSYKAEAERVFTLADTDNDGKLNLDELSKMTGFAKIAKNLLGKIGDGTGLVSKSQWVTYIESKGDTAPKILQLYENALTDQKKKATAPSVDDKTHEVAGELVGDVIKNVAEKADDVAEKGDKVAEQNTAA